ncbi:MULTISPECIES: response regulator transcription factor [Sporosarcina]|uniref:response regulator transcription factor n=1 Tax=Sporosarcina TaxID=1569 RepID=UPI00058F13C5|nr:MULTISPECIES: response regulator transcription factor [Sporosarcina]WJY26953.1 response regulator transcription factor [Sporosarcina sp. 0.2-SM1T-5]
MIRIVLAEDQGMLLGAFASLLNLEEDMEVIGQARNGEEAVQLVQHLQPDICIMDIEMPVKTGLEAAERLQTEPCKIIILTTFARAGYFERARKAGVRGYLLKDSPFEELAGSIRSIMAGRRIYAPELVDLAYGDDPETESPLTEREAEVLELISDGRTTKQIAAALHLTPGTVRNYISIILDKMSAGSRIEAVKRFQEKGWSRK